MNGSRFHKIKVCTSLLLRTTLTPFEKRRGEKDKIRLQKKIPQLQDFDELSSEVRKILKPHHETYISEVSTDIMAISLELSVFLTVICKILKPKMILDLGSGFSSFVFRLYALNTTEKPVVWSVDDSPEWLEKTREYLVAHNLPAQNLVTWDTFTKQEYGPFDLIFHDLGGIEVREHTLKEVLGLYHQGTKLVLDDFHSIRYKLYTKKVLRESNIDYYSLKNFTQDEIGRYSILVTP